MSFLTFPVSGLYQPFVPGGSLRGQVKFTSNLIPGSAAHGITGGLSIGVLGAPVFASLIDGALVPTDPFSSTVTLYSNDPQLNLPFDLEYTVSFSQVTCSGQPVAINSFTFNAPADSTPVVLA